MELFIQKGSVSKKNTRGKYPANYQQVPRKLRHEILQECRSRRAIHEALYEYRKCLYESNCDWCTQKLQRIIAAFKFLVAMKVSSEKLPSIVL